MSEKGAGYTLIELLVVISIIGILTAIYTPVISASRAAAYQFVASHSLRQMGASLVNYTADYDDMYPVAMRQTPDGGLQTWFGYVASSGEIDSSRGSMAPYLGKSRPKDPTANYKDYLGDHSGFGYNWETLGSDYSETRNFATFPNCSKPAVVTQLEHPSTTVAFATSVFLHVPWQTRPDAQGYDFGFVSPPRDWQGNPNMDFRHMGLRTVDPITKTVQSTGNALVLFADGSVKALKQSQVQDKMFERKS